MKTIIKCVIFLSLLSPAMASAEIATFTYRYNQIPNDTKNNYTLWACEYKTSKAKVVLMFEFYCPFTMELNNYGK